MTDFGLTIKDVFPDDADDAAAGCNPCFEQSEGVLVCDGTDPVVKTPPVGGGPWALVWTANGWDWANLGGMNAPLQSAAPEPAPEPEQAPEPRESGGGDPENGGQPPNLI